MSRGRGWYRADLHVHSVHSDGELTPQQLAAGARAAGLDAIATTDHNTAAAHGAWGAHGSALLVVLGEEVTTPTGHWLALGLEPGQLVDWDYRAHDGEVGRHVAGVHRVGGLCVVAHPHAPYPTGDFEHPYEGFDAVEVWNGAWTSQRPWQADNEAALADWGRGLGADVRAGRWRPAVGGSDTHLQGQIGTPQTVVLAEELTAGAVLAGLRAGRSWVAESAAVELSVEASAGARTAGPGERLETSGEPAQVRVDVRGVPAGAVGLWTERGEVHCGSLPGSGTGSVRWRTGAAESALVRVEVRHPGGGMAALSNPVLLA